MSPLSDAERASLTWLAGFEAYTGPTLSPIEASERSISCRAEINNWTRSPVRADQPQAYVRTVGRIGEFHPRHPDPDGGRLFRRFMTTVAEAPGLLGWGPSGLAQAQAAARIAADRWGVPAESPTLATAYVD
ncbi:MAG: hypothetical protein ACRDQU_09210 [Pseudonocardiaceae bacterium]